MVELRSGSCTLPAAYGGLESHCLSCCRCVLLWGWGERGGWMGVSAGRIRSGGLGASSRREGQA